MQEESVCKEAVYQKVYDDHALHLRNFLYYKTGQIDRSEDLVHESFIKLWENCKDVVVGKAKSFLFTVGNRLFLNQVQHNKVKLKFQKEQQYKPQDSETPEEVLREKEFKNVLEEAISELSEKQREVFLLNRIDKMTYKEIAELLEISEKAVEKRMHQALKNLKDKVEELKVFKF